MSNTNATSATSSGATYYGEATWEQGLFSCFDNFTHCANCICGCFYPNTLSQITRKADIKICGTSNALQVRRYLWALAITNIILYLFSYFLVSSLIHLLFQLVSLLYVFSVIWTIYELHKGVENAKQLLPTCCKLKLVTLFFFF